MMDQVFGKTQPHIVDEPDLWNNEVEGGLRQSITETEKFNNALRDAVTCMLTEQTHWAFTWMRHGADLMARNVETDRDAIETAKVEH